VCRHGQASHIQNAANFGNSPRRQTVLGPLVVTPYESDAVQLRCSFEISALPGSLFMSEVSTPGAVQNRTKSIARILGSAIVALVVVFSVTSFWKAAGQRIWIVNGLDVPITVSLDGATELVIESQSRVEVPLDEGSHHWDLVSPDVIAGDGDFEFAAGFFGRVFHSSVLLLDPARSAVSVREVLHLGAEDESQRFLREVFVGESFVQVTDADFVFEEFPESLRVADPQIRIDTFLVPAARILGTISNDAPVDEQMEFCETHLLVSPKNPDLLDVYQRLASRSDKWERGHEFLQQGLDREPVEIDWHRSYQSFAHRTGRSDALFVEYDRRLSQSPENSALLYLRGRIEPNGSIADGYYQKSIAADPDNSFPWFARCHHLMGLGEFAEAKHAGEQALRLRPDDRDVEQRLLRIRLALGENADVEAEVRRTLETDPTNLQVQMRLLSALAAQDKLDELQLAHNAFELAVKLEMPLDPLDYIGHSARRVAYSRQDFETVLEITRELKDVSLRGPLLIEPLLELGRYDELSQATLPEPPTQRGFIECLMFLGLTMQGDRDRAGEWYERAIDDFRNGDAETRLIVTALEDRPASELFENFQNISMTIDERLIVTLIAAVKSSGEARLKHLALAERLNCAEGFPKYFAGRLIESLR
jgi:tetratricopeptide (TPR) repeat protein